MLIDYLAKLKVNHRIERIPEKKRADFYWGSKRDSKGWLVVLPNLWGYKVGQWIRTCRVMDVCEETEPPLMKLICQRKIDVCMLLFELGLTSPLKCIERMEWGFRVFNGKKIVFD